MWIMHLTPSTTWQTCMLMHLNTLLRWVLVSVGKVDLNKSCNTTRKRVSETLSCDILAHLETFSFCKQNSLIFNNPSLVSPMFKYVTELIKAAVSYFFVAFTITRGQSSLSSSWLLWQTFNMMHSGVGSDSGLCRQRWSESLFCYRKQVERKTMRRESQQGREVKWKNTEKHLSVSVVFVSDTPTQMIWYPYLSKNCGVVKGPNKKR